MPPTDFERDIAAIKDGKTSSQLYADLQPDHNNHAKLQDDIKKANDEFVKQGILNHLELIDDSVTGNQIVKNTADNTSAVFTKNGAILEHNDKTYSAHVTKITRADGSTSELSYGSDKDKDAVTSVTNIDPCGNKTTETPKDGDKVTCDSATGDVTTTHSDGTTETHHADGTRTSGDGSGALSCSEMQAQGKISEANAIGQLARSAINLPKEQQMAFLSQLIDIYGQLGALATTQNIEIATAAMSAQGTVGSSISAIESSGQSKAA